MTTAPGGQRYCYATDIVTASDLQAITPGNLLCKYADDSYLIVPSSIHLMQTRVPLNLAMLRRGHEGIT